MRKYEGMFIISPDLNEESTQKVIEQITELITGNGGQLESSQTLGKRYLSYEMKKKTSGVYLLINFRMDPLAISKLKKSYALNENILKALITKGSQMKK